MIRSQIALLALLLATVTAHAQTEPWESPTLKIDLSQRVKFSGGAAPAQVIADRLMKVSGVTLVVDPALTDKLSIFSAGTLTLGDAFTAFQAALKLSGYQIVIQDKILVVKKDGKVKKEKNQAQKGELTVKVYRLEHADAARVARVISDVFKKEPLRFQVVQNRQTGSNIGIGQRVRTISVPQQPDVVASSEVYSNSVVVRATKQKQIEVGAVIKALDLPSDKILAEKLEVRIYSIRYAASQEILNVLLQFARASTKAGEFGMDSDSRTNSLIVTATASMHEVIAGIIAELDRPIAYEPQAFVIPVLYASAAKLADLLRRAFQADGDQDQVTFTADPVTNSIIVYFRNRSLIPRVMEAVAAWDQMHDGQ